AVGGDLSAERLLLAYHSGIFPWFDDDELILWYAPHERFVLDPAEVVISKSMRKILREETFRITTNAAFDEVITACSAISRPGQDGTWITEGMIGAYKNLHKKSIAQSVEVWLNEELVGGLYGVAVGRVFCGESMFSRVSNASKAALIYLCQNMPYQLIDCQVYTEHLASMGAHFISKKRYESYLPK
ncbi:MAG: leucyl/phenylalanyl-tRNA--protein transferase, partial [Mucilaginibacter polytrichastri]|nr:leucyl/phenylalanyl-tRNA--protein transferase [Mucilaginibacter polytrichastri]